MNFHEYQAKDLFAAYDIPVPAGKAVDNAEDAVAAAKEMGGNHWVIKAQVHAGGRGKAGGVKLVKSLDDVRSASEAMLGMEISTYQTGGRGLPVNKVLVAEASDIDKELYLSLLIDRASRSYVFMASASGGVDIEQVAQDNPDAIITVQVGVTEGLQGYHCRQLAFGLGLKGKQIKQMAQMMRGLYRLFTENDLSLIEVNPLVITPKGDLLALDAKINADENGLFRHPELAAMRDESQEDPAEAEASRHHLNYVTLDGNIACMVNGAGLAMATMDVIKLKGGEPANFLDVGGGTNAERVAKAFDIIFSDPKVEAVLINIFGGIVRCDMIAEGIIAAVKAVDVKVPIVVRLEGTNVEKGIKLLEQSGLAIIPASDLNDGATKAVAAANQ